MNLEYKGIVTDSKSKKSSVEETEFKIKLPDGTTKTMYLNWDRLIYETAFNSLRTTCFWNGWDFNQILDYIKSQDVSIVDVYKRLGFGMSIAETCELIKKSKGVKV